MTEFFRSRAVLVPAGIADLPGPWLWDLPRLLWQTKRPHWTELPYMIDRVVVSDGVLRMWFMQEQPVRETRVTAYDRIRVIVNLGLRPNLGRR